jgi:prevent-host-death family protein
MREASFTELRNQATHFFDLVEAGEVIRVTRNGKPIAEIHPVPRDLPSWKRRPARPLVVGGISISQLILQDRGE